MKDISILLLESLLILLALISLISADPTPKVTSSASVNTQEHVSEVGLRYAFHR
jgi:hypothetical protein